MWPDARKLVGDGRTFELWAPLPIGTDLERAHVAFLKSGEMLHLVQTDEGAWLRLKVAECGHFECALMDAVESQSFAFNREYAWLN